MQKMRIFSEVSFTSQASMKVTIFLFNLLLAFLSISSVKAASAYSPVVGFLKFDCPADSDTIVSVPFHQAPRFAGKLSAAPAVPSSGVVRITLAGTPDFAAGELTGQAHYLVSREAGSAEGRYFPISTHGTSTVDVEAELADFGALAIDSPVSIVPAWTLEALFPDATQTTFHPSSGPLASGRGSELLLFDAESEGSVLAPSKRYFVSATGWQESGTYTSAADVVIAPGQPFIVRHPAGVFPTQFVAMNQVFGGVVALPLRVTNGKAQDNTIALPRPVPTALGDLDPGVSFEESASTDPGDRKDELLVFNNASAAVNKAPSATYFRTGGNWVEDTAGFPVSNAVEIELSAGIILRKAPGTENLTLVWTNAPLYDVNAP
jgi:uncharacterized protein (TIGR02597 family)